ncbi:hypothetical protein [Massilia sp. YIM B02443]|uniref:outer membrane lipoprotein n=1 Tax=Massilia sp. YIM B02443 TaxID=3050127 RepID=UPI0025B71231|nr:hypothetical protein [Massilia sp. YIM B02443]MDN4039227.1 hypothetical protein [Massilia sp. YIM B02443]
MRVGISISAVSMGIMLICGCTSNISPTSYSVGSVGQVNRTVAAKVISVRPVQIDGTNAAGGTVGGALGATAGSGIGGSDRANIAGALAGAVVGAIAGAAIEKNATKQSGLEYVVQTENNNLMTVVQGSDPAFSVNDKVLVLYGSPSRLIPDPRP